MPGKKKRGKRTNPVERQSQILAEALVLFASRGFGSTSLQEIADKCGISQSAIFYHYRTKDSLLEALIKKTVLHNHTLVQKTQDELDSALVRIEKYFTVTLDWAIEFPDEARIICLVYYAASIDVNFRKLYQQILAGARGRIEEYLKHGVKTAEFAKTIDAKSVAEQLHDLLLGGIVNLMAVNGGETLRRSSLKKWKLSMSKLIAP